NRSREDSHARRLAASVKTEFLHAWHNYERYAWGHDALRPLSKTPHDWYGQSLLMTPVDALDTLILMKLDAEAAKAKALIVNDLSFDRDTYVKNFEITIRLLGGLLSSYNSRVTNAYWNWPRISARGCSQFSIRQPDSLTSMSIFRLAKCAIR